MDIAALIDERIRRALRALRLPFRARLTQLNGDPALQLAQGQGLAGEQAQAVEVVQQFGFSSGIPEGSQLIVLPLAGRSSANVVIATEHGAYRLKVGPGEARMYSQEGAYVHIRQGRVVEIDCDDFRVKAKNSATIEAGKFIALEAAEDISQRAPQILQQGNVVGEGYDGGLATVSNKANITNDGTMRSTGVISSDADVIAGGKSGAHHVHPGDSGGTTGEPE